MSKQKSKRIISHLLQMILFLVLAVVIAGGCNYLMWRAGVWYFGDGETLSGQQHQVQTDGPAEWIPASEFTPIGEDASEPPWLWIFFGIIIVIAVLILLSWRKHKKLRELYSK
ncbi:MAG: hypothetical protein FWC96_03735 [Oscillospiraceae bacterium]|nr:hypothetical protein [Oscillospiraceae bacterium]